MMKLKQLTIAALMASAMMCSVEAMAGSCTKQGSSTSIDWIKKKYKNCTNCGTQKDKKGKTVYYCYCGDGCGASNGSSAKGQQNAKSAIQTGGSTPAKKSGSCEKVGSSSSVAAITAKRSDCYNCGTQQNKGKTVYYCYCGSGCSGTPASAFKGGSSSSSSSSYSSSSISKKASSSTASKGKCASNQYFDHTRGCLKCPKHASCNGTATVSCAAGYFVRRRSEISRGSWLECAKTAGKTNAASSGSVMGGIKCPKGYHVAVASTGSNHTTRDKSYKYFEYCQKD